MVRGGLADAQPVVGQDGQELWGGGVGVGDEAVDCFDRGAGYAGF